jgi:hypothetical protein
LELEVFGNATAVFRALQPRRRLRFEPAHQQSADFFLEVDVSIGIAKNRQVAMYARDHVSNDVKVLAGEQRDRDAEPTPQRARPLSAAEHDDLGGNLSVAAGLVGPLQLRDASLSRVRHRAADAARLADPHTAVARALAGASVKSVDLPCHRLEATRRPQGRRSP